MKGTTGLIAAAVIGIGVGVWAQSNTQKPGVVPPGDWVTLNRDYAATRYSPLTEINAGNVAKLVPAWSARAAAGGSAVPLVVNGVMYVGNGGNLRALDAATGKEIWSYSTTPGATVPPLEPAPVPAATPAAPAAGAPAGPAPAPGAAPGAGRQGAGPGGPGGPGGGAAAGGG